MEEPIIEVKENPILTRVLLFFIGTIFLIFLVLLLILDLKENNNIGYLLIILMPPILVCFFFGAIENLLIKSKDYYTKEKMYRIKRDKVIFEITWNQVEKIVYISNFNIDSFIFGPTTYFIYNYLKRKIFKKRLI